VNEEAALSVVSVMPARSSLVVQIGGAVLPGYAGLIRRLGMGDIYPGRGRYSRPLPLLERALVVADPTRHCVARWRRQAARIATNGDAQHHRQTSQNRPKSPL